MKKLMLLGLLLTAGCGSSSLAPTTPFNKEATVAEGQSVVLVEGVAVEFVGVLGDSRCPADAMCIQGGDAVVKLAVTNGDTRRNVELHTGNLQRVTSGDLTIDLLELMPYPFSSNPIKPGDYRAKIRVMR
jgi:hypothetical protein